MEIITISEWKKIKSIVKEDSHYSIYKYFYDNFEKDKENMLVNSFYYYLCYLNKNEFNLIKEKIEEKLNRKFDIEYQQIPLFNNNNITKEENVSLIKPKIEYENLNKELVLELINKQNKKDLDKELVSM